ncbi:hypothetical protein PUNSTDRAFT_121628 [Punctularia strigosozonata HHB-11173 SS5]|uniref:uncharacterized protein n=1 Tax=Punctularia strigosozonata (strain HHB-11173) TaxID=741275 RepID=UPI00044169F8|nr:uncharacterized protein PUNSTDRAFT_121628 [Punctularia strigosozonata HHB-11173 SS5]EIN06396.1 hypothetical protein PUNSTDRAFT_121628 [Punctularia strigosozonata HHB-11173 SS5]
MSSSRAASSSKYDPYEEEEAAQLALRLPVTNIKQEDGIISAVPSCAVPVKQEDVYTPSSALVDYLRTRGSAVFNLPHEGSGHDRDISRAYAATNHAKQEQWDDSAALHPPDLNSTRKAPSTSVKLEPPEPSIPSSMSTRDPRRPSPPSTAVKLEPPQRSIPLSMSTRDPRRRPPSLVRVKTEEQELGEGNLGSSGRKDSMQRAPGNVEYDRKHATSLATLYGSHKRLKEEDVNRDTKRIKKEQE